MKRNSRIELYRIFLMFAIVLLHAAGKGDIRASWLGNLLKFSVVGFVFISGYFGIQFSWRKVVSLYVLATFCAILDSAARVMYMGSGQVLLLSFGVLKSYWFLHAYAILMMFAPVLNLAISSERGKVAVAPILFLVFGWSYCYEVGHLRPFVFPASGLGGHTPLSLIGIYVVARLFRVEDLEAKISSKQAIVAFVICLPFAVVGLAPYNSVFAVVMASSVFVLLKRLQYGFSWAVVLAPSMFSIYLLHCTWFGSKFIRDFGNLLVENGISKYCMFLIVAVCLFSICLIVDLLRRMAMTVLKRVSHA